MFIFGQKGYQNRTFSMFFGIFSFDFPTRWKENYRDTWLPTTNSMSGKIPIHAPNWIVEFQKLQYLRNELRHEVDFLYMNDNLSGLGVAQMGTHKLLQNNKWAVYSEQKIEGTVKSLLSVPLSLLWSVSSTFFFII